MKIIQSILLFLLFPYFLHSQSISGDYFSYGSKCKIFLKVDSMKHFVFNVKKIRKYKAL